MSDTPLARAALTARTLRAARRLHVGMLVALGGSLWPAAAEARGLTRFEPTDLELQDPGRLELDL